MMTEGSATEGGKVSSVAEIDDLLEAGRFSDSLSEPYIDAARVFIDTERSISVDISVD